MIPQMTQIALRTHEKDMMKESPEFREKRSFSIACRAPSMKRSGARTTPSPISAPAFGPCSCDTCPRSALSRRWPSTIPTAQTEDLYFKSINTTVDQYRIYLQQVRAGSLVLVNSDLDTGKETKAAEYSLTDETYAKLLDELAQRKFDLTSPDLRDNILNFYSDLSLPLETKKNPCSLAIPLVLS